MKFEILQEIIQTGLAWRKCIEHKESADVINNYAEKFKDLVVINAHDFNEKDWQCFFEIVPLDLRIMQSQPSRKLWNFLYVIFKSKSTLNIGNPMYFRYQMAIHYIEDYITGFYFEIPKFTCKKCKTEFKAEEMVDYQICKRCIE